MLEIINMQQGPIPIIVRSKRKLRSFTTLTIPGRGKGFNRVVIEDEAVTEYIKMVEKFGLISTRVIN